MKRPIRCPTGTVYDAAVHAECPCASCWADRSFHKLTGRMQPSKQTRPPAPSDQATPDGANAPAEVAIPFPLMNARMPEHPMRTAQAACGWSGTRKLLSSLAGAIVIAALAAAGSALWVHQRLAKQIDASFEFLRAQLGTASHGQVTIGLFGRTITISEIVLQSGQTTAATSKVGQFAIEITGFPWEDLLKARRIEAMNVEMGFGDGRVASAKSIELEHVKIARASLESGLLAPAVLGVSPGARNAVDVLKNIAELIERIEFGQAEVRGVRLRDRPNVFDLNVLRVERLNQGKLAGLTLEGFVVSPPDPARMDRLTIKAIDAAGVLRAAAQLSGSDRPPTGAQLGEFLALFDGFELAGLAAPETGPGQTAEKFRIESAQGGWGQLVGRVPTTIRASTKATMRVRPTDQAPFDLLAEAGLKSTSFTAEFGGAWTERTRSFAIAPISLRLEKLFSLSASVMIGNVPPGAFAYDPIGFGIAAAAMEAGTIELSLTDTGFINLLVLQAAKKQSVSPEAARRSLIDTMKRNAFAQSQTTEEFRQLIASVAQFIDSPGSTIAIKLTPKGRVNAAHALALLKTRPAGVLAQFGLEATVRR